jgi:ATP-dependent HslUV protease ATP-binding subunit HslU
MGIKFLDHIEKLSPRQIVEQLDKHIIGQKQAKRAVAIALRNRWRRLNVPGEIQEEITPKNIIMIGATGVGKTEVARRLAKLAEAPFYKVEASKFTEVGYVGKDVESMIRDLVEISMNMVRENEREQVTEKAKKIAEEKLLDLLLPTKQAAAQQPFSPAMDMDVSLDNVEMPNPAKKDEEVAAKVEEEKSEEKTREKLRKMLKEGKLDERKVEIDINPRQSGMGGGSGGMPMVEIISAGGSMDDIAGNLRDMFGNMMPQGSQKKKVLVPEALEILTTEEAANLIDNDKVVQTALKLAENNGIIFLDEIDKIASKESNQSGDVSREGVQRDILPIVEGSTVSTKYGVVKTNHILFISSGAFHVSKPSDLIPELQGRFPIRVEMDSLTKEDFYRILTEPEHSLTKQYQALMSTEGIKLEFTDSAIQEISSVAAEVNEQMENIGARRLHTILENVMDEISYEASERDNKDFVIDESYVKQCLAEIVKNQDLSQYIL